MKKLFVFFMIFMAWIVSCTILGIFVHKVWGAKFNPSFIENWTVVEIQQFPDGRIDLTLVNPNKDEQYKAAYVIVAPMPIGYIVQIIVLYDGCDFTRYALKEDLSGYFEVPPDDESKAIFRRHFQRFLGIEI